MRGMRRALGLLCACGVLCASAQTMYKWVDEKGVTHFSETPPPEGAKGAAKIEVKPIAPDKAPVDNWKQRELESKQRRVSESAKEEAARKDEAQRARRCSNARNRVDKLTHAASVYHLNEKGERVYLEEKERAQELEEAKRDVARDCG